MSYRADAAYEEAKRATLAAGMKNVRRQFQQVYGDRADEVLERLFGFSADVTNEIKAEDR